VARELPSNRQLPRAHRAVARQAPRLVPLRRLFVHVPDLSLARPLHQETPWRTHHDMTLDQRDAEPVCRNVCRSGMYLEVSGGPTRPCLSTKTAGPLGPAVFGGRCRRSVSMAIFERSHIRREHAMPIQFRRDVDQVLKDAKAQQKPVLLDFSAAPM